MSYVCMNIDNIEMPNPPEHRDAGAFAAGRFQKLIRVQNKEAQLVMAF